MQSFLQNKKKSSNLGPNMPYVDIFEIQFCKAIVIFEISTLDLWEMESVVQNKKISNIEPISLSKCKLSGKKNIFEFETDYYHYDW